MKEIEGSLLFDKQIRIESKRTEFEKENRRF